MFVVSPVGLKRHLPLFFGSRDLNKWKVVLSSTPAVLLRLVVAFVSCHWLKEGIGTEWVVSDHGAVRLLLVAWSHWIELTQATEHTQRVTETRFLSWTLVNCLTMLVAAKKLG